MLGPNGDKGETNVGNRLRFAVRRTGTGHRPVRALAAALSGLVLAAMTMGPAGTVGARPLSLSDLTWISPSVGWLRVSPVGGQSGALYRTTNGGARWTLVSGHIEATSLVFRNKADGEALVPVVGSAGMCQVELTAVRTTDGGTTWGGPTSVHTQDAQDALAFHGARPFLLNGACAVADGTLMAPTSATRWSAVGSLGAQTGFPTVVSLTPSGSFATLVYGPGNGSKAPVIRGFVYRIATHTWHKVDIASIGLPARIAAASFVNGRAGVVATVNGAGNTVALWTTQNGGRSWARKAFTMNGAYVQPTVDMVTPSVVYAALSGDRALMLKSTDGGRRWIELTPPA